MIVYMDEIAMYGLDTAIQDAKERGVDAIILEDGLSEKGYILWEKGE